MDAAFRANLCFLGTMNVDFIRPFDRLSQNRDRIAKDLRETGMQSRFLVTTIFPDFQDTRCNNHSHRYMFWVQSDDALNRIKLKERSLPFIKYPFRCNHTNHHFIFCHVYHLIYFYFLHFASTSSILPAFKK